MKTILSHGRWFGMAVIFAILGYAWSEEPVIDPEVGDPFPLARCIIGDTPFEDAEDSRVIVDQGREIRVCCDDCENKFPEEAYFRIDEIDKLLVEQQRPYYPSEKCIVTGDPLEDGTALEVVFRNRLFRLSSEASLIELKKSPAKFFSALDLAVIEKQKADYPLTACVVSGEPLGDDAMDHVVANQLVRLAGFEQFMEFNENPGKYLLVIRNAKAAEEAKK